MYDFLWDDKPDKIKRKTIIQDYENGGLKMIDLSIFITSIKAGWAKRITNNDNDGDWKHIYKHKLDKIGGDLIYESNIGEKDFNKIQNIGSKFLSDVVQSWSTINFDDNPETIRNQIIWNNSFIKNSNKLLFYKQWYAKGIKYIDHLYDKRQKTIYTFEQIKTLYNLNNSDFLKYHTLIRSIPNSWKLKLKDENIIDNPTNHSLLQQIQKLKSVNKFLYNKQLNSIRKSLIIKPHIKWETEVGNINWKIVHTLPFQSLIDTKIRAFQYKYVMRIVPNNKFLYKCNISNTSLCDFCTMHVETNKHLFWECQYSRAFWTDLEVFLTGNQITLKLDYTIISLGYTEWSSSSYFLNFILIYAKYFIFKNKYSNTIPSFANFKNYLRYIEKVENVIASVKDKLTQHNEKWGKLQLN